jgi:prepilin-type N-terminal cleavage/methylation domain-containing protein
MNNMRQSHTYKKGFTLIELMVSVTIFAIVMVISMGAILTVVDGNKKNQTMQVAINNLNFAVESMTRSIKTGYDYDVQDVCRRIRLKVSEDQDGDGQDDTVNYYIEEHENGNDGLYIYNEDTDYSGFITAPDLNITEFCFHDSIGGQPALGIVIQGEATGSKEGLTTRFNLYTSVTQRQVDYD